jgi:hypothetical protein
MVYVCKTEVLISRPYQQEPDTMALRKEDKTWVADEIQAAIREHLDPHGWKKFQRFLPVVSVIGIFIALLALAGAGWNYAFSRVGTEARFQTHTTDAIDHIEEKLVSIEGTLTLLQAQIVSQKYSAVRPKELKTHVEELKQVKTALARLPTTSPGYWPTAFQVIQLASQSNFADFDKIAVQGESSYNNVSSKPPGGFGVTTGRRAFLKNHVEGLIFKDSIIRFDPSVELVNDVFINCVFLLPVQENPPKPLQQIGKTLLASDLAKVTLDAS